MRRFYLDTSAAAKLLVEEAESVSLAAWADGADLDLVATHLLETELRRFAIRHSLPQGDVSAILARVDLHGLPPSIYREAGLLPGPAGTSHGTGALRVGCTPQQGRLAMNT